jgi:hypothetical protein
MFFTVTNSKRLSTEKLRTDTLLNAYFIIKNYPLRASETVLENYLQQQYKSSLKNMCIKLLLSLTFYKNDAGDLLLMFKDPKCDTIAKLITYGNGVIPGSKILQIALNNRGGNY